MIRIKAFFINSKGISCFPCRCKRQSYHKKTLSTKESNIVTTNVIEDRRNLKCGSTGRHVSPDGTNIFKNEGQIGSVEICDTGLGTHKITPEECEERLEVTETDIETVKEDIQKFGVLTQ